MKRAYSVNNVLAAKFNTLEFDGVWRDAVGCPELSGTWIIYGTVKNGKTSFAMKLAKYLTKFEDVLYNSVEEGVSLSIREAFVRYDMQETYGRFNLLDKEEIGGLITRLNRKRSPNVIFIDTVQFWELTFKDYKRLKETFSNKLFIYVSHAAGNQPEGKVAIRIWRDANVAFRIEGFKAFPVGRYGGGEPLIISKELAKAYWAK
ncbi:MAG: hypothetical protein LBT04_02920 [Prevotellaceae bacterium]|jgi:hypothetical protein|nr:hypothetical protein [Prevotellaceae bacterium]